MNIIGVLAEMSQRILNAKALADSLYASVMEDDSSDNTISFAVMMQEQLVQLEKVYDLIEPAEVRVAESQTS